MTLWIGSDFSARSFWVMRWIALAAMVNGLAYLPYALVQAANRPDLTAKFHVAEVPVYLAGLWLGLRLYGVEGAAFVYLGRVALDAALLYWAAARILPAVRAAVMRTALRLAGGAVAIGLAFVVAAPALRAAYVAVVVAGFGAWGWRAMLAPSERETVRMRLRAAMPLMSR
jgi:O-antigen/teichoic acid export membrane protein